MGGYTVRKRVSPVHVLEKITFVRGENNPAAITLRAGNNLLVTFMQVDGGEIFFASSVLASGRGYIPKIPRRELSQLKKSAEKFFQLNLARARECLTNVHIIIPRG